MISTRSNLLLILPFILLTASILNGQENAKPTTTLDTWRQALPSQNDAQPVEAVTDVRPSAGPTEESKAALVSSEQSLIDALKARDADSLNQLISDDFTIAIARLGSTMSKGKYLEHALQDLKLTTVEIEKTRIRIFGRTGIITFVVKQKATMKDVDWSGSHIVTSVWINQSGTWRLVSRHESQLVNTP